MKKVVRIGFGGMVFILYGWMLAVSYCQNADTSSFSIEVSPESDQWQSGPVHDGIWYLNPGESQVVQGTQRVRTLSIRPLENVLFCRSGAIFNSAFMRRMAYHAASKFLLIGLAPFDLVFPFHSFW